VPNNSFQLSQLIGRLWERTQVGKVPWEQLSDQARFQTRQGDFLITVWGSLLPGFGVNQASLEVKRLNGVVVAQTGTGAGNPFAMTFGSAQGITDLARQQLNQLLEYLADRNTDLDELLRTLG
jgi:hypothetical protein